MRKLNLLFTKNGLQYQISKNKMVLEEHTLINNEDFSINISEKLDDILLKDFSEISVISAINHFALMPENFDKHELGLDLISFNADVDQNHEELMLSINKKFGVQFYYTFPKAFYQKIKGKNLPTNFNFSGEKFLNSINHKNSKEIHINLYHHQCEFLAVENGTLILYNNLDVDSEVDFLYFVMFTLSRIGFGLSETKFFVYGETTENDTFISELQKFVKNLKIVFDNIPNKNFILN